MKPRLLLAGTLLAALGSLSAEPALTIYNQKFAVVRDTVPLDLKAGRNEASFRDTTAHVEPDSVILRDPSGKVALTILEQNYRNDPVSQSLLLSLNEGQTIDFLVREPNKPDRVVPGRIIRSGYVPHAASAMQRYGNAYAMSQVAMAPPAASEPIIEVEGRIRFGLPGQPLFPTLGDDTILKPTLNWVLDASRADTFDAELCYITGGMTWEADYNIVAPEKGDLIDLVGWVTMDNQSGKNFSNAKIKLMAGDVNRVPQDEDMRAQLFATAGTVVNLRGNQPPVTEKAFDEYHLYSLERPTTLRDRETKQVEFLRAAGVKSERLYVYDGMTVDWQRWRGFDRRSLRTNEEFGSESDSKVAVMREFVNSKENGLGVPLPAGRVRFYRQDGAQLEFVGENRIDHTPKDEKVLLFTRNTFDLVGERRRVSFKVDNSNNWADETIEIKLRNRKKEAAEIRVVEHLYRWINWEIVEKSHTFLKLNAQEMSFACR